MELIFNQSFSERMCTNKPHDVMKNVREPDWFTAIRVKLVFNASHHIMINHGQETSQLFS